MLVNFLTGELVEAWSLTKKVIDADLRGADALEENQAPLTLVLDVCREGCSSQSQNSFAGLLDASALGIGSADLVTDHYLRLASTVKDLSIKLERCLRLCLPEHLSPNFECCGWPHSGGASQLILWSLSSALAFTKPHQTSSPSPKRT